MATIVMSVGMLWKSKVEQVSPGQGHKATIYQLLRASWIWMLVVTLGALTVLFIAV
jgi:hypothetical protein